MSRLRISILTTTILLSAGLLGCVERTVKIETRPPGALVIVNDKEVGVSPVKFSFLWYGDYDLIVRKEGYDTLKTHFKVDAPWYQYPVIDLVAETMIPQTIHDDHVLPPFELTASVEPDRDALVKRAEIMHQDAVEATSTLK